MNLNLYRDRQGFLNRCVLLPVFVPFIVVFLGRLGHGQTSIQDRIGLLYQSVQVPPYVGIVHAVALCESAAGVGFLLFFFLGEVCVCACVCVCVSVCV